MRTFLIIGALVLAIAAPQANAGDKGRMNASVQKIDPYDGEPESGYGNIVGIDAAVQHPCVIDGNCSADLPLIDGPDEFESVYDDFRVVSSLVDSGGNVYVFGRFAAGKNTFHAAIDDWDELGIFKFDSDGDLDTAFGDDGLLRNTTYKLSGERVSNEIVNGVVVDSECVGGGDDLAGRRATYDVDNDHVAVAVTLNSAPCQTRIWVLKKSDGGTAVDTQLLLPAGLATSRGVYRHVNVLSLNEDPQTGDIYAIGQAKGTSGSGSSAWFTVKLNSSWAVDTSFGDNGYTVGGFNVLGLMRNGSELIGVRNIAPGFGLLDTSCSSGTGCWTTSSSYGWSTADATSYGALLAISGDVKGKTYASTKDNHLVRISYDGSLVTSFGTSGAVDIEAILPSGETALNDSTIRNATGTPVYASSPGNVYVPICLEEDGYGDTVYPLTSTTYEAECAIVALDAKTGALELGFGDDHNMSESGDGFCFAPGFEDPECATLVTMEQSMPIILWDSTNREMYVAGSQWTHFSCIL